jgi:hypothetical protein
MKTPDWNDILKAAIAQLIQTPLYLLAAAASFVSGHIFVYMYFAFLQPTERRKRFVDSITGRLAFGAVWFALVYLGIHLVVYGTIAVQPDHINSMLLTTCILGLICQIPIFLIGLLALGR